MLHAKFPAPSDWPCASSQKRIQSIKEKILILLEQTSAEEIGLKGTMSLVSARPPSYVPTPELIRDIAGDESEPAGSGSEDDPSRQANGAQLADGEGGGREEGIDGEAPARGESEYTYKLKGCRPDGGSCALRRNILHLIQGYPRQMSPLLLLALTHAEPGSRASLPEACGQGVNRRPIACYCSLGEWPHPCAVCVYACVCLFFTCMRILF